MYTIGFLSQDDLDFGRAPLHSAHPTGDLSLHLLSPQYFLGVCSSLLDSTTPLLPSSLLPSPFLSSPLLLLTPHSAATWPCARPSTQPKCAGSWAVPVALPPNRPTPSPHSPSPSPKCSSPLPSPPSSTPPFPSSPSPPSPPPGFPAPSLSLPPGPGVPHPLPVELPPGIHTGNTTQIINNTSSRTCSEQY